jgi:hypothetical protein
MLHLLLLPILSIDVANSHHGWLLHLLSLYLFLCQPSASSHTIYGNLWASPLLLLETTALGVQVLVATLEGKVF